jgi:hypothetical protein
MSAILTKEKNSSKQEMKKNRKEPDDQPQSGL